MMGFLSGQSLRPSLTGDILRFPTVRIPFRLPSLGSSVMVAMGHFVSLVACSLPLGSIVFVYRRHLLGALVLHTLGPAGLTCVSGIGLVRGLILVIVKMRLSPLPPLLRSLLEVGMFRRDILGPRLSLWLSRLSYFLGCVVLLLTVFLS